MVLPEVYLPRWLCAEMIEKFGSLEAASAVFGARIVDAEWEEHEMRLDYLEAKYEHEESIRHTRQVWAS